MCADTLTPVPCASSIFKSSPGTVLKRRSLPSFLLGSGEVDSAHGSGGSDQNRPRGSAGGRGGVRQRWESESNEGRQRIQIGRKSKDGEREKNKREAVGRRKGKVGDVTPGNEDRRSERKAEGRGGGRKFSITAHADNKDPDFKRL